MKRIVSLVLMVVMVIALAAPVSADTEMCPLCKGQGRLACLTCSDAARSANTNLTRERTGK